MLRIAFAGTPEFSVPTLRALAASAHTLVGVLTQPDRPAGRGREIRASAVKQCAESLQLPVAQPARLKSEQERAELLRWNPDLLVVVAYGLILPPAALAIARLGCINVHASLLPRWRGAAPIQRAILAGDTDTGVTIMRMEAGLDTGPMYSQRRVALDDRINAQQLHDQLSQLGADALIDALPGIEAQHSTPQPQPLEGVTYAAKIDKGEALIDWQLSAAQIARQVRAFYGWPVAHTLWQGQSVRVWQARVAQGTTVTPALPGSVLGLRDEQLWVACGDGVLGIEQLQLAGRRPVSAREFAGSHSSLTTTRLG